VVIFLEVVETFLLVVVAGFVMAHLHRLVRADAVYALNGDVVLGLYRMLDESAIRWTKDLRGGVEGTEAVRFRELLADFRAT
jgi:hypothetical protein